MKIGIDIQTTLGQKTGFGFYVGSLVDELRKIDGVFDYQLLRPESEEDFSAPKRFLWDQIRLPMQARRAGVNLLHQPAFSAPVLYNGRIVVTVHDLIAVHFGHDIPFWSRKYFGLWMPFSYRFADHIIAVSEHTKKDLIHLLKIPEEKITVICEASEEKFRLLTDRNEVEKVKIDHHTGDKFILHIGTLNPRKNLEFLVSVFAEVVKKHPDYKLVIAGKRGWYYEGLLNQVDELGLKEKVIFIGYLKEEDKVALYNAATIYAFPSLYEGFGLPPLEAMACGTPVVASDRSSIPEVVGNAGILLDPTDKTGWIKSLNFLIDSDMNLKRYRNLGLERAKEFSWRKTAEQTIKVYAKVLGHKL